MTTTLSAPDLKQLATEANASHENALRCANASLAYAKEIGQLLERAKEQLPHGQFGNWIIANCRFSVRTAQAYMRVNENWSTIEAKRLEIPDLSIRGAIESLSEPNGDDISKAQRVADLVSSKLPPELLPSGERNLFTQVIDTGIRTVDGLAQIIVLESCPIHPGYIRYAMIEITPVPGSIDLEEVVFSRRPINRKYVGIGLASIGNPEEWKWMEPMELSVQSNPLAFLVPEWNYPELSRHDIARLEHAIEGACSKQDLREIFSDS